MQIIRDRRSLHQIPELDKALPKTMAYLTEALSQLGCRVFSPMEGAVCGFFDFGADQALAFRSDADALPIQEQNRCAYASRHPGRMHACGHDGHMAILLELARRIDKKQALNRNILLVFQPAEETTGGAKDLCETRIFEQYQVEAIFGLHLWPNLEKGVIASRRGELMARSCEVTVDIAGKSAHIAKAAQGIDALAAGVEFYKKAAALEKSLPKEVFRVLNFGKMESGSVRNAISAHTHLEGSLRAFQDESFDYLRSGLLAAGKAVEESTGCTVHVGMNDGYPAVMNPPELYGKVRNLVQFRELDEPSMTAEDFSWYQKYLPGMFFFLGLGDTPALHADNFDFDESVLLHGADFFEQLAEKFQ